jgi:hypothetical protein
MSAGVPKLADALRRAAALGLRVENVNRTGEVRVWGVDGVPVTSNARKKDASQALLGVIRAAENGAALVVDPTRPPSVAIVERPRQLREPRAADLLALVRSLTTDGQGWAAIDTSRVAEELAWTRFQVARTLASMRASGRVETMRKGKAIVAVRQVEARPAPTPPPRLVRHYTGDGHPDTSRQAARLVVEDEPETPLLDAYRRAREAAVDNPYLTFTPDPALEEAAALIDYLQRGDPR